MLEVSSRLYSMLVKLKKSFRNFPKYDQEHTAPELQRLFLDTLTYLDVAQCVPSKKLQSLQHAQAKIFSITRIIKLARDSTPPLISYGYFEELDLELTEIKKRLKRLF